MKKDVELQQTQMGASMVTAPAIREKESSPEESAGLVSKALFLWVTKLFRIAAKKRKQDKQELQFDDLFELPINDDTNALYSKFQQNWQSLSKRYSADDEATKIEPVQVLWKSLFNVVRCNMILALFVKLLNSSLQFTYPILLNFLLTYIQNPGDMPTYSGYLFAFLLGLATFLKAVCESNYYFIVQRAGWRIRSTVATAVYMKSLRLSASARQELSVGQIINLMQIDSTKMELFITQAIFLIDGVYQIVGYVTIIYFYIGWSAFVGVGVMMLAMPIQMAVMLKLTSLNRKMASRTDERVKLTNEGLQGILAVKMSAWEKNLVAGINAERAKELGHLQSTVFLSAFSTSYMLAMPAFVAVASLGVYAVVQGGTVTAAILFAALSAFAQLRFPLMFYPMALASYAQASVSVSRVAVYLSMSELQQRELGQGKRDEEYDVGGNGNGIESKEANVVLRVHHASFGWSKSEAKLGLKHEGNDTAELRKKRKPNGNGLIEQETGSAGTGSHPVLKDISVSIKDKSLAAIIGPVGSGKSSLINAILGEMFKSTGKVYVDGTIALATQSPWISNDTIRNNILFGEPFVLERYTKVIEVCQLRHDLDILEDGDQTMIGERGINLSGGQKQRISVARLAYSRKSIVILDDPLSALDPKVAQDLFHECILDFMKDRTRVLVTNQINVLCKVDEIIVLNNGCIEEYGSYDELMAQEGKFAKMLEDYVKQNSKEEAKGGNKQQQEAVRAKTVNMQTSGKELIQEEERNVGAVGLTVYRNYIKHGGGNALFAVDLLLFAASNFFWVFTRTWVALWTDDASYEQNTEAYYLIGYALIAIAFALTTYLRTALIMYIGVLASKSLHLKVLESVLHAPMSFFDTTPLGRVLSRFSKDMYSLDSQVPEFFNFFLFTAVFVLFSIGTIVYTTPIFAVAVPPLLFVYYMLLSYYRPVARDVKRLEAISRSPVYAHFSETLGGLSTIRAYNRRKVFEEENAARMNFNIQVWYCVKATERWLALRLEIMATIVTVLAGILAVVQAENSTLSAGLAGVSLSFALSLTDLLGQTVRSFANLEAGMNSVERILHYSDNIPQEAAYQTDKELPKGWPSAGAITFQNLKMRYRDDTPLVLKGLSFNIAGGERVGVVGRTGSGKSSLFLTLLRLVEADGQITIDGVDIGEVGLHQLRSKISIVPQNPVIFSGTLRSNLDPFDEYTDVQIEVALKQCSMWPTVQLLPLGLDNRVTEGGENFSQGQRQLLCLARSLLKNSKILMLDEATSSVDFGTDAIIQKTIRQVFTSCTILTIAHRLSSVLDNDKILVLENGEICEYGPPGELLNSTGGKLYEMVHASEEEAMTGLATRIMTQT